MSKLQPSFASRNGSPTETSGLHNTNGDRTHLFDLRKRPGYYNADARAALLRRSKIGPADELFIDFSDSDAAIELTTAGQQVLSGIWRGDFTAGGKRLPPKGPWIES